MDKQLIISVSREFGSGGHVIAQALSEYYGIPYYNNNILTEIATDKNVSHLNLAHYDERPKGVFITRTVRGYSSSPSDNIALLQFDFLKKKADLGESFVVLGRCAEEVLAYNPNLVSFFVRGDYETKIQRTMDHENISAKEAKKLIKEQDTKRRMYHNHHCTHKWGDSRHYDMCINSSTLGIDGTTEIIKKFIDAKIERG